MTAATILVVDDEPDLEALVLQKFRKRIRDGAVTFIFAHDGIEALQSLEQNPHVGLIVLDINMPRMDGLSLLQKLQLILCFRFERRRSRTLTMPLEDQP